MLGVRKSTANHMDLAELGGFPPQSRSWRQILRQPYRTIALGNSRLVKPAMSDGFALDQTEI